jgi:hypothetical protein
MGKSLKTIIVEIDPKGGSKIEAQGFTNASCLKETESLEEALGKVSDRKMKAEGLKPVTVTDTAKVGSGS